MDMVSWALDGDHDRSQKPVIAQVRGIARARSGRARGGAVLAIVSENAVSA
jgi:hypothetical protein